MKRNFKTFIRTFYISAIVMLCIILGFWGTAKAYSAMRLIAFGEYRNAVSISDDKIRLFDFEIEF